VECEQGPLENVAIINSLKDVFSGKTVFITGHTGFKGAWLSLWLHELGANVIGFALAPSTQPSLFDRLRLDRFVDSRIGDVRDAAFLRQTLGETRPEIVFHLAAQPIVRFSYLQPAETFSTNVQGTVNLLDAVRQTDSVRTCQVISTDKCYENREKDYAYRESDRLGGRDPYSASKACAEMVVSSYRASFFMQGPSIASARAGNVIGGGDWSEDRLLPDCMRALMAGRPISIRNPNSIRPWQFVLEPLSGYLLLAAHQLSDPERFSEAWNFGPLENEILTTAGIANLVIDSWGSGNWVSSQSDSAAPHEAGVLKLNSSKSRDHLKWRSVYNVKESVRQTIAWYRAAQSPGFDMLAFSRRQIAEFMGSAQAAGLSLAHS
jgi:CDP-glucose 4,6-dehydratase